MRKFMWCCATQGNARRYFSIPSHHSPLMPRRANPEEAGAASGHIASIMETMTQPVMNCFLGVLTLMATLASPLRAATTAPATTQATSTFTRHPDVIYGRSYGTAL